MGGDVLFVRELAADRDLVLAFAPDGSPAWALDLESGLQWWYPGGDRARVREAIATQWSTFAGMPVSAASYAGPHPAVELGRQADAAARVTAPEPPADSPGARLAERLRGLSPPARLAAAFGALALALMLLPPLAAFLLGGAGLRPGASTGTTSWTTTGDQTGDQGGDGVGVVPATATAGERCDVRGEVSHDTAGRVLVCVPPSRALSYQLIWRAT